MEFHLILPFLSGIFITAMTCVSPLKEPPAIGSAGSSSFRIMFYNTENFFDTEDDALTADEDFTPAGNMHWTSKRFEAKLRNIYKVIVAAGAQQPPDIIGLCEVENLRVLENITENTPLAKYSYRIIHKNSADRRGIDAAILYNANTVRYLSSNTFTISKKDLLTRDILYFKAILGADTCHVLVNHWPSRSEGQLETEGNRIAAARLLKHITDSLFAGNASGRIIIIGDFNDEPSDESLLLHLMAEQDLANPLPARLYNLADFPSRGMARGTLKYQGQWNLFDQIIVSGGLLTAQKGLTAERNGYRIFSKPFLLSEDRSHNGYKPYRTYSGFKYLGGFSDHLPVYLDLISH